MPGDLKRRPADAALLWGALFAALLPSIFLAGPVAWWVWERNWPGIGWLSRIIAVGVALLIPAVMLGAAWFAVRWVNDRDAQAPVAGPQSPAADKAVPTAKTEAAPAVAEVVDRLEMEPIAP